MMLYLPTHFLTNTKTFRLPVALVEKLGEAAQKNNISMTKLVIELCEYGLENLEESDS